MQQGIFKKETPFEKRVELSTRLRSKYPERVPTIVECASGTHITLNRKKFLVQGENTMGKFLNEIRKHSTLKPSEAIFLFCGKSGGVLIPTSHTLAQVYDKYKDDDGMLYIIVAMENTFGGLQLLTGAVDYFRALLNL